MTIRATFSDSRSTVRLGAVLALSLLCGCAADDGKTPARASPVEREIHNIGLQEAMRDVPANKPTEYRRGYMDGCDTGYNEAGAPDFRKAKDSKAYAQAGLYKNGWDDGFATCNAKAANWR